jgi:hypothetical protein
MTSFFFGPNFAAVLERFPKSDDPNIRAWHNYAVEAGGIANQLAEKRAVLTAAGKLTPSGIRGELRVLADRIAKPHVDRLEDAIAMAERQRATVVAGVVPKAPDPRDAAAAQVRGEIRSFLRGLAPGDRAGLVLEADEITAAAITEAPPYLSAVEGELRDRFEERRLERAIAADPKAAPALALLDGAGDVLRAVAAGLRSLLHELGGAETEKTGYRTERSPRESG